MPTILSDDRPVGCGLHLARSRRPIGEVKGEPMARLSEAERERIKLHHKVAPGLPKIRTLKPLAGQREFNFEASTALTGNKSDGESDKGGETGAATQ
jgi:hypothetical protein